MITVFCRVLTGYDRNELTAWHGGDALVQAVAAVNPNTVVVAHSTGPILVEAWIDNPHGSCLLFLDFFFHLLILFQ